MTERGNAAVSEHTSVTTAFSVLQQHHLQTSEIHQHLIFTHVVSLEITHTKTFRFVAVAVFRNEALFLSPSRLDLHELAGFLHVDL